MTIKEIEALTGMKRANIRFYESEGLLNPQRDENGYRNYSEADVETLRRIRLLRTLRMPLPEIKALHTGERTLSPALEELLNTLNQEQEQLSSIQRVCTAMQEDGAQYSTLDTTHYLNLLEQPRQTATESILTQDVLTKPVVPWRRFFARGLDMALYTTLIHFGMALMHINFTTRLHQLGDVYLALLLLLMVEPLLLSRLGTTFGKWIFGLSVTDGEEHRLTYSQAWNRTLTLLFWGEGAQVPFLGLYRNYRSYQDYTTGAPLPWENESEIQVWHTRGRSFAYWAGLTLCLMAVTVFAYGVALTPPNRGSLTPAQFCENYNHIARFAEGNALELRLNENAEWVSASPYESTIDLTQDNVTFTFDTDQGAVTRVYCTVRTDAPWFANYQTTMTYAALAFAGAQERLGFFDLTNAANLFHHIYVDASNEWVFHGTTVSVSVSCSGFDTLEDTDRLVDYYFPVDGEPQVMDIVCTIEK